MIWLFERGDRIARMTTRWDAPASEYVLEVEWVEGQAVTERFADPSAFATRLVALEQLLRAQGWIQSADSPEMLAANPWIHRGS
jgi:hypothetical protein